MWAGGAGVRIAFPSVFSRPYPAPPADLLPPGGVFRLFGAFCKFVLHTRKPLPAPHSPPRIYRK